MSAVVIKWTNGEPAFLCWPDISKPSEWVASFDAASQWTEREARDIARMFPGDDVEAFVSWGELGERVIFSRMLGDS